MSIPNNTNFDGIHVSKGFVRGLQGQVLRLEQNQQSLIQQLEHANRLATEYHASAVSWQHKYDAALDENENTRQALERETLLRMSRESELEHFKNLLQEQLAISSSSSSQSRSHTPSPNPPRYYSQQYQDQYPNNDNTMSPVSVAYNDYQEDNDSENEHDEGNDAYSQSSRTTDCSGDPICHSDSD